MRLDVFGFCDFYDLKEDRSGSGPKAMNFLLRLVASSLLSDDVGRRRDMSSSRKMLSTNFGNCRWKISKNFLSWLPSF